MAFLKVAICKLQIEVKLLFHGSLNSLLTVTQHKCVTELTNSSIALALQTESSGMETCERHFPFYLCSG